MYGPASDVLGGGTYPLADSTENNIGGEVGEPLTNNGYYFIGKAWCLGDWVFRGSGSGARPRPAGQRESRAGPAR